MPTTRKCITGQYSTISFIIRRLIWNSRSVCVRARFSAKGFVYTISKQNSQFERHKCAPLLLILILLLSLSLSNSISFRIHKSAKLMGFWTTLNWLLILYYMPFTLHTTFVCLSFYFMRVLLALLFCFSFFSHFFCVLLFRVSFFFRLYLDTILWQILCA